MVKHGHCATVISNNRALSTLFFLLCFNSYFAFLNTVIDGRVVLNEVFNAASIKKTRSH